ncbi:glycosyl hydrolase family 18 protein [Ectobacillus sp. JY-23]|uniref:glycosyl hydrolase family 18 protein n=1 Tax=Ectobacillus sp. JY-23 TaxID=2933872 RepID=UPI001FF41F83|nr:glycosyl hydrolase family 18 protein [Ectobacillus sp. JY-23]UOY92548.1 glycosyl hydrolase family 18 protein [Ectobacillus sp. JY-23]
MKRKKQSSYFSLLLTAVCLLAVFIGGWTAPPAVQVEAAQNHKIVGYFTSWGIYGRNFQVEDIDGTKLTHINYAFADICWDGRHGNPSPDSPNRNTWSCTDAAVPLQNKQVPNGTIVLGEPWADVSKSYAGKTWAECEQAKCGNFGKLLDLKKKYPHLKTLISVGGWTWSNRFSDVAADPQTRQVFAKSAVEFIRTYGFDGVDLDWEYPVEGGLSGNSYRPADKQNYTLLLQDIRNELNKAGVEDGKTYLLTIASGASAQYVKNTELSQIAAIVDWINIMTYDFHGGWETQTNHNAPLYATVNDPQKDKGFTVDESVTRYQQAGVPMSKLVLGMPFYGRGWKGVANGNNGEYQTATPGYDGSIVPMGTWDDWSSGASGVFDYGDLVANYVNKNGFTRYWNDTAKVPFLYNPTTGVFISYDDIESFGHKTNYIKAKGMGGAMFWELSSDCRTSSKYTCTGAKLLDKLATELLGTTPNPGDTEAPAAVKNVTVSGKTANSVTLAWTASTDNVGVAGYDVSYGTTKVATATNSITISGLQAATDYTFTVTARDSAGNVSLPGSVTVKTNDATTPPPTGDAQVTFTITSDWGTGFNFNVTIKNNSAAPIKNWRLAFDYDGNITQVWDAKIISKTGTRYVLESVGWNSEIPAGGTVSFGGGGSGAATSQIQNVVVTGN